MASGRYRRLSDISELDSEEPRTSRYFAANANLCFIKYSEHFPGDKRVSLYFKNATTLDDFLMLFKREIQLSKIPFDSLISLDCHNKYSPGIKSTTNASDHLKLILFIACDYAEIEEPLKREICRLPDLILPSFVEQLCNLADASFAEAMDAIRKFKLGVKWYSEKNQRDFLESLIYQLGLHFEGNPETYDKAIDCYDKVEKDNSYFARAQLHRARCYKLFMETDLQNPLLKEITFLRKEIAALNERVTTLEKTSFVPQKDERKPSSGPTTMFKKQ